MIKYNCLLHRIPKFLARFKVRFTSQHKFKFIVFVVRFTIFGATINAVTHSNRFSFFFKQFIATLKKKLL